jgi:hypothetical protein
MPAGLAGRRRPGSLAEQLSQDEGSLLRRFFAAQKNLHGLRTWLFGLHSRGGVEGGGSGWRRSREWSASRRSAGRMGAPQIGQRVMGSAGPAATCRSTT